ncbi:LacI family DNA-binding transcriptional regulator [Tabrizicola sp.]|uniref:LacI family DNA-binding transcriptional regulator n=1 Tax=Tabrizicola sp. TaxID=2005166 RepID=UPI003F3CFCFE
MTADGGDPDPAPKMSKLRAASLGQRRVTMTDVARVAGCSQATVSFVLNKAPGVKISEETRARVIEAARALNYAVTSLAHLDNGDDATGNIDAKTGFVGFVVDQLATSPEAVVAIDGARHATMEKGEMIWVAQTMNDPEMEQKSIRTMIAKGATALVYMTIFTREIVLPEWLRNLELPVVLLNCYTRDQTHPAVIPAEVAGGQRATRHLIDFGHRRIATITGEPWMEAARDRLKGYRKALTVAGITPDPALVVEGNWSASSGYDATRTLLSLVERPTAIFCQNDRMAIGCYEALKEAGLVIPDDMSVVGYDDEEISRHLHPQLTTLVLPQRAMGVWAIEQLSPRRTNDARKHPTVKLEGQLIERQSVAPVDAVYKTA